MHFSEFPTVFLQMAKCICPNCNNGFYQQQPLTKVLTHLKVEINICLNCNMHLFEFASVFLQMAKCICPNCNNGFHQQQPLT